MDLPATARPHAPYGLSFPLQDLLYFRSWARRRGWRMDVLLDQVFDGAEFEELLLVRPPGRTRRALSIWLTATGIIAQATGGKPRSFTGALPVTEYFAGFLAPTGPATRPSFWRNWLSRS